VGCMHEMVGMMTVALGWVWLGVARTRGLCVLSGQVGRMRWSHLVVAVRELLDGAVGGRGSPPARLHDGVVVEDQARSSKSDGHLAT